MRYLLAFLVLLSLLTIVFLGLFVLVNDHGWDAQLYCQAAALDRAGGNPYLARDFIYGLPWLYPPGLLNIFRLLCAPPLDFASTYVPLFLGIAVACLPLWRPGNAWPMALVISVGGFTGLTWSLMTGNLDLLFLLPISLVFWAVERRHWEIAALGLAIAAGVKLFPIVHLILLLLAPIPWRERWRALAVGLGAFVVIFLSLTLSRLPLLGWYWQQLLGRVPGQYRPVDEFGSISHPAFPYLIARVLGWPNDASVLLPGLLVGALVLALLAVVVWRGVLPHIPSEERFELVFALGFLALHLIMPRLKPYSFTLLTPALFWLMRRQALGVQSLLVLSTVLYPAIAFYIAHHWPDESFPSLFKTYSQPIALLIVLVLVPVAERFRFGNEQRYARTT
ncbi:MAG: glycosyltransferase 87 family protein [Anaerolineales bacterium]|nr:glycosyltransferase 87 family protein [Anaerolineales bacterium]MCX7608913.1 glycosyltransferase 87 family protein [Anaerolineales bacterium]MDW8226802.1 glycosyltransferase 87 family protein [Anaerolineales bacterium]